MQPMATRVTCCAPTESNPSKQIGRQPTFLVRVDAIARVDLLVALLLADGLAQLGVLMNDIHRLFLPFLSAFGHGASVRSFEPVAVGIVTALDSEWRELFWP